LYKHLKKQAMKTLRIQLMMALSLLASIAVAQTHNHKFCGTYEAIQEVIDQHPYIASEIERHEAEMLRQLREVRANGEQEKSEFIYTIPVVFHIIHNYGPENISDAQVLDAVRVINEGFMKLNADTVDIVPVFQPIAARSNIQFRLATIDPYGNCTNGINRIASVRTYGASDASKLNPWPRHKYLNIWVVNSIGSQGVAGYAYKPSGANFPMMFAVDGILILHDYIGAIGTGSAGRAGALTHEIGHYLGLDHPWGATNNPGISCGDDGVDDTPITRGWTVCNLNGSVCTPGVIENVQNYMEYAYCDRMFTEGQKALMRLTLENPVADRNMLSTVQNLTETGTLNPSTSICAPVADFSVARTHACVGQPLVFTNRSWKAPVDNLQWNFGPDATPTSSTANAPSVTFNRAGWHPVTLTASNSVGSNTITKTEFMYISNPWPETGAPFSENFSNPNVAISWPSFNLSNDAVKFQHTATEGRNGGGSFFVNSYNNQRGEVDQLMSPGINMSYMSNSRLSFWYSCASRTTHSSNMNDKLEVQFSTNCGATWQTRQTISGAALANAGFSSGYYRPTTGSTWNEVTISIPANFNTENFKFRFVYTAGANSNNLYIDDISITGVVGLNDVNGNLATFDIYPNPADELTNIQFNLHESGQTRVEIMDIMGKTVAVLADADLNRGQHLFTVSRDQIGSSGIYFVRITGNDFQSNKKLIVR
jgi:PKD repeat protein